MTERAMSGKEYTEMAYRSLYGTLKRREADQEHFTGKLVVRADELIWEESAQGRNAPLVDAELTGLDCRSFGMLLTELPPGKMSGLHKHSFEAVAYIISGEGYEVVGDRTVQWSTGDTVYLPPNIPHRHVNTSTDRPARILQVEAWPLLQNLRSLNLVQLETARAITDEAGAPDDA